MLKRAEHAAEEALLGIMQVLRERTGHALTRYKRAILLRRIERRLQVTLPEYAKFLQEHAQETTLLLQDMPISVTNFFRDRTAFDALERIVIEELFEDRSPAAQVRAWVAGCATGEEAYSVAMLLLEHASSGGALTGVQVFATDIDERALAVGRAGLYAEGHPTRPAGPACAGRQGLADRAVRRNAACSGRGRPVRSRARAPVGARLRQLARALERGHGRIRQFERGLACIHRSTARR